MALVVGLAMQTLPEVISLPLQVHARVFTPFPVQAVVAGVSKV
jgi:hypothetical protein